MTLSPSRIVLARKLRGMTLVELSRQSGLNTQTIHRYESGKHQPSDESIKALATALALPVDFFAQPEIDPVPAEAASFRALSKTPAFRRDAALAAGEIAMMINGWIEANFRLPRPDVPTLNVGDLGRSPTVEDLAARVRSLWNLGSKPIDNMVHLVESHGVRVFSLASEVRDVDAFSVYRHGTPYIFLNTSKTAERQRFDVAHELAHLVLHQTEERPQGREIERQADKFAAALLMPLDDVLASRLRNASTQTVIQASPRWKVSAMALAHRLSELDQVTEWGYRSCCVELSKLGYRSSEPGSQLRPESSQLLEKVFAHLRSRGSGPREIAGDLCLTSSEFNRHVFNLAKVVVENDGGRERFGSASRNAGLHVVGDPRHLETALES